jgi:hypothetical protein
MVYLDIPFVVENKRIDRDVTKKELAALEISQNVKDEAFEAIYNRKPLGITFDESNIKEAHLLERLLSKLGIPYRLAEVSEFA